MPRHPMQAEKKSLAGQAPWSPAREKRLERAQSTAIAVYICVWVTALIAVRPAALAAAVVVGSTVVLLLVLRRTFVQQERMAANKPRASNAQEMTVWEHHPPDTQRVLCGCGRVLNFKNAERFPVRNPLAPAQEAYQGDPLANARVGGSVRVEGHYPRGQERYSMVCECLRGHYKLIS